MLIWLSLRIAFFVLLLLYAIETKASSTNCTDNPDVRIEIYDELKLSINCPKQFKLEYLYSPYNLESVMQIIINNCIYGLPTRLENIFCENDSIKATNIIDVTIDNFRISDITEDFFQHFPNIEKLSFRQNSGNFVTANILKHLKKLNYFEINNVKNVNLNLPKHFFVNNVNLERLFIEFGSVKVDERLFKYLNKLKTLEMVHINLNGSYSLFHKCTYLEVLNLAYNNISTFQGNEFSSLISLKTLHINNNRNLRYLPDNLFHELKNLETINLDRCGLENLSEIIFWQTPKLLHIDLSHNKLKRLPSAIFSKLNSLKSLYLKGNLISSLQSTTFKNLQNLQELDLDHNPLITFAAELSNISILSISNAKINMIQLSGSVYKNIIKLNLSNNFLVKLPDISELHRLKEIDLSNNSIIEDDLSDWTINSQTDLYVDLSFNKIKSVNVHKLYVVMILMKINKPLRPIRINLQGNPLECNRKSSSLIAYKNNEDNNFSELKQIFIIDTGNFSCNSETLLYHTETECPEGCKCKRKEEYLNSYRKENVIVNCAGHNYSKIPNIINFYKNVTELYLGNNEINRLDRMLPSLKVLDLHGNKLTKLNESDLNVLKHLTTTLKRGSLYLHDNPWICECDEDTKNFRNFLQNNTELLSKTGNAIKCSNINATLNNLSDIELCFYQNHYQNIIVSVAVVLVGIFIAITVATIFYYRHQHDLYVWLYTHKLTRWMVTEHELDKDKIYDAFISYAHQDEDFVRNELLSVLETGSHPYKLCLHGRDWIPGEMIQNNIVRSVQESRRTIIVLSKNFLNSMWGILEFRTAHTQAVTEGRVRVIIIIYEQVNIESLDEEMKNYLKMNTYLEWDDPWFWKKFKYALPHRSIKLKHKSNETGC